MRFDDFQQFIDLLPEPTMIVSGTGTVLAANQSCLRPRFVASPGKMLGRRLHELVVDEADALSGYLRMCSRTRQSVLGALVFPTATGQERVRCEGAVIEPASDGRPAQILLRLRERQANDRFALLKHQIDDLAREITRRMRAEETLETTILELEDKNAELERFAYTVSHELKSPLVTIGGFLGMLLEDLPDNIDQRIQEDIATITKAADGMHEILDELLALSRIGRIVSPSETTCFSDVIDEALKRVAGPLAERSAILEIEDEFPDIFGDRGRLVEVIQNLIENSLKYSPGPRPRIGIGARRDEEETVFFVDDDGVGVDSRYHEKIFGLFEQLDGRNEGSGVGLAIVKRIVEVHNGHIWIESEGAGRGSRFCFTLPQ